MWGRCAEDFSAKQGGKERHIEPMTSLSNEDWQKKTKQILRGFAEPDYWGFDSSKISFYSLSHAISPLPYV
jgi:hypothetical protein